MNLTQVLMDVLFPIFLIFGIGVILGRTKSPDPRSIAHLSIFVLLPSLVFATFIDKDVLSSLAVIGAFVVGFTSILYVVSLVTCRLLNLERAARSAFLLSVLFTNSGNYGVPLCTFAFGEEGTVSALAYMMYGSVIMYTFAVYIASRGTSNFKGSLLNVFKIPLIYAVVLASLISYFHVEVPSFLGKSVGLLGSAAIPVCMVLLGIQLSHTHMNRDFKSLVLANIMRLGLSPLIGIALTSLMGIDGVLRSILLIECSMPTAINSVLIAIEFDAEPGFVSSAVLTSTIASIGSLAALLLYVT
ncbi:MAG: AEC family transporter [Theionarchaea archaeon]|nr:AEC family transporter [Theionarchaea archaeon]MBU6999648.1 AEC family transporter [Theionarchaea archaeon]MBU7020654.1 AEC family transporter [Theionarchaea archaeon]MBU7035032.1 AEC family transporter [Theionarchaea archaeon]MBU7039828.1 AEC family transporter [Theionarchaea archaeon]